MNVTLAGNYSTPMKRSKATVMLGGATWNPGHTFLVYQNLGALPYPPATAANLVAPWNDSVSAMARSVGEMQQALETLSTYQQANERYLVSAKKFYDDYWHQSGTLSHITKASLVRASDMAILTQGVAEARDIFQRAANQIAILMKTKSTSNMPAATAQKAAASPVDIRTNAYQAANQTSPKKSSALGGLLLIPVGLAAAYFLAKG